MGTGGVTVYITSTRFSWNVGDSGSVSGVPPTAPAPVLGVVHCAVLFDVFTPTALEHMRTETVAVEAVERPMLAMARVETTAALGSAVWAGDEVP